jgi:hypothetical protein
MNELKELRIDSYESSRIYKAKIKKIHDKFFLKIHLPFFSSSEHVFQDFGGYKDGEKKKCRRLLFGWKNIFTFIFRVMIFYGNL